MGYEWGSGCTYYWCISCEAWVEIKKNPEPDDGGGCPHCGEELFEEIPEEIPRQYFIGEKGAD